MPPRPPRQPRAPRVLRLGDSGRRLRLTLLCFGFVVSLFAGRLVQLQGFDSATYASEAVTQRMVQIDVPATRGEILDSDGVALATSVEAVDLVADQTLVTDPKTGASPEKTAEVLSPLVGVDVASLTKRLMGRSRYAVLAHQLTPALYAKIAALHLAGVLSSPSSTRVYPAGSVAAGVVGFLGGDGTPLGGLELTQKSLLAGTAGETIYEAAAGKRLPLGRTSGTPAKPGTSIQTSIDRDVQWVAEKAIADKVTETGAEWGAVLVQDIRTGRVLVIANSPSFDPNHANVAASADLKDRAVEDVYEPGSTSKVITMSAALQEGVVTPDTVFTVPDKLRRSTATFNDDEPHPTQRLTVTGILAQSSNVGTIKVSEGMSKATIYDYLQKFGLGQRTKIGLPGETPGILAPWQDWSGTQRYTIAFGQGLAGSLLQQASVFQTIANGGVRISPTIIGATVAPDGSRTPAPLGARTQVVSAATARKVMAMLEAVVNDGTGVYAAIPGYRIAGKTGTAQIAGCDGHYCEGQYQASFIGVVPADAPRFVVAVTLKHPHLGPNHFGGYNAGPVFKTVASLLLKNYAVAPSGTTAPVARISAP